MKTIEANRLGTGLYRIYWKSGGSSPAAVGILHDGRRWYAPVNWTSQQASGVATSDWRPVLRVEIINAGRTNWTGK